jgi:hypothetical protein
MLLSIFGRTAFYILQKRAVVIADIIKAALIGNFGYFCVCIQQNLAAFSDAVSDDISEWRFAG